MTRYLITLVVLVTGWLAVGLAEVSAQTVAAPVIAPDSGSYDMPLDVTIDYASGQSSRNTTIRYTLDGSDPGVRSFALDPADNVIEITSTTTVKAKSFQVDLRTLEVLSSKAVSRTYTALPNEVAPPSITPPTGSYDMPLQVTIDYGDGQQNQSNTSLRYTLDGSEPTAGSLVVIPEQGDTLYLNNTTTVKAKSFQTIGAQVLASTTTTVTYTSTIPTVATPVITPGAGVYNQPHTVTITTATPGATIRYRTDGRAPSFFYPGTLYTGPIVLDTGTYEITARGYKDGYYKSETAYSGVVIVNPLVLPTPTIYPAGGSFGNEVTVYIGSTVLGADIRYTIDGSEPMQISPEYDNPIVLNSSATVQARIYLDGYTESPVNAQEFVVAPPTLPVIATQPQDQTVTQGSEALFTVIASGVPDPSYQWLYNGLELNGETQPELSIDAAQPVHAGNYRCIVSNSAGQLLSDNAVLAVSEQQTTPVIDQQPQSQTAVIGSSVTFSVAATGNPVPSYQWQFEGTDISGETGPGLTIDDVQTGDAGDYRCVVTNTAGEAISENATLTVIEETNLIYEDDFEAP